MLQIDKIEHFIITGSCSAAVFGAHKLGKYWLTHHIYITIARPREEKESTMFSVPFRITRK